ncbi:MAG: methyltransferase domain-containing protein [Deltaproteobacteria bacterium]|nr:methyltransferase domain-containing protein [Deltaproteobacteria bacterium]
MPNQINFALIVPNSRYGSGSLWSVLPSRGLLSLAAILRHEGYGVHYIDADIDNLNEQQVCRQIIATNANIVGITMNTFQAAAGLALAALIKTILPKMKIIIGGPHPSAVKDQLLIENPTIDISCIGEGEKVISQIAAALATNASLENIHGICYRHNNQIFIAQPQLALANLDDLPFPAYDLAGDLNRYPGANPVLKPPSMHIMASRGCPYRCIFCTHAVFGKKIRFRSPSNIIDEVELLHKSYGINEIFFQDDTMNVNRDWFYAVCNEIEKRDLHKTMVFKAPFRVSKKLLDEELLQRARHAGFWMLFYGVESGDQDILNTIKKDTTIAEIKRAFKLTHAAGIETIAAFMVGNVGETAETIAASVELCKEIEPSVFGFSIATPLPGSEYFNIAIERKWIESVNLAEYSQFKAVARNQALSRSQISTLRDKADSDVRQFFAIHERKRANSKHVLVKELSVSFPANDKFWSDVLLFVKQHITTTQPILAPDEFHIHLSKQLIRYGSQIESFDTNPSWAIVHKGRIGRIGRQWLSIITKTMKPVFANEVFVVFSLERALPNLGKNSLHVRGFWEIVQPWLPREDQSGAFWSLSKQRLKQIPIIGPLLKRIKKHFNRPHIIHIPARSTEESISAKPTTSTPQFTSGSSVGEIKSFMDGLYASGQAYQTEILWDQIRAVELAETVHSLLASNNSIENMSILDVGCGAGGIAPSIPICKELIGIELSDVAVAKAQTAFGQRPEVKFMQMDAMKLDFPDSRFDAVVAREVLEHLPNMEKSVAESFRVLKPGGIYVVTSPNRDSLHLRINRALDYKDFTCSHDHVHEFTYDEMCSALTSAGFLIDDSAGVFLQPYWGISGIDQYVRHLTDNDPQIVEMLRILGRKVGAQYAFCYAIRAKKPTSK